MCLLDRVESWDADTIECSATSHLAATNPLRENDRLSGACVIEYAAQAAAVHGALCAGGKTEAGMLASVRELEIHVARLDDLSAPLTVRAEKVASDERTKVYAFAVHAGGAALARGRFSVVLRPGLSA